VAIGVGLFEPLTTYLPPETLLYHLHYFLLGVVVSIALSSESPTGSHPMWDGVFVAALVLTILIVPRVMQAVFGATIANPWGSPIALTILTVLLASCLRSPLAIRILGGKVGRFYGDISYSVYLLHLPVLNTLRLVEPLRENVWVLLVVFLSTVTSVAYLSYRIIEVPSRRFFNSSWFGQRNPGVTTAG
jgi:peptidoglycan/LPS O-acetylase OafA/YrhL